MKNKNIVKNKKAQALVAMFAYVSVVSLIGVYITIYAKNLHGAVVRSMNHTKAYYAAEAGMIRMMDQMEQWRRAGDANFISGARAGTYGPNLIPDMSRAPATIRNKMDFNVTTDVVYNTNQTYRLRSRVSNWL